MADGNGRGQSWVAYTGMVVAIATAIYSAGALGQRVTDHDTRIGKLESEQAERSEIRERLARIEERLNLLLEQRK